MDMVIQVQILDLATASSEYRKPQLHKPSEKWLIYFNVLFGRCDCFLIIQGKNFPATENNQVFGITWPVIEPQSPRPLANNLTIMLMSR